MTAHAAPGQGGHIMHFVKAKGILSAKNGMNLYRGCSHGCIYCDSRSNCYHMEHAFEDIEVKENAIELLEDALTRKRKKCMIGTGSMTDPYIPLEMKRETSERRWSWYMNTASDSRSLPNPIES